MNLSATYSFQDVSMVLAHPSVGQFDFEEAGTGGVNISQGADSTEHNRAADGVVMPSKIIVHDGTVTITVQQTSEAHKWMTRWYNYIKAASPSEWAAASLMIASKHMQVTHRGEGVSPQKRGDKAYQTSGDMVSWALMCCKITEEAV